MKRFSLRGDWRLPVFIVGLWLASSAGAQPLAFVNVNVIPMDTERVVSGQTVLINEGRIVAIGTGGHVAVPEDAVKIDGTGRYLLPGLNEMHAHVPRSDADIDRVLGLFLAHGVTSIRGMLGASVHLPLREQIAKGERLGPRLITSGPSLNGRSVSSPEQAVRMIKSQHEAGYDFVKLHPGLTRAQFDAIVATANALEIPFAGHVSEDVGIDRAIGAKQDSIDHLDGYMQGLVRDDASLAGHSSGFFGLGLAPLVDDKKLAIIARRTAAAGVWNVPTQALIEHYASAEPPEDLAKRPAMRYMPKSTVARWVKTKRDFMNDNAYDAKLAARAIEVRRQLIKALHDAGAGLLLGSDSPQVFNVPGMATLEELEILVASGLTPYQALITGTVNPATYFGVAERRGQVVEGHDADLVLLTRNPLKDIRATQTIEGVMVAGRWLSRDDLDALLAKASRRSGFQPR